jgi:hypothetical protein
MIQILPGAVVIHWQPIGANVRGLRTQTADTGLAYQHRVQGEMKCKKQARELLNEVILPVID